MQPPNTVHEMSSHSTEVARGQRFEFGENWARFLSTVGEVNILSAEQSLCEMLGVSDLRGKSFLDIGSGSGLFSLAARRLGARVHSFDFDPSSVACTNELRRRYFPDSTDWVVEEGSALDREYVASLGTFDVVYSWGVLHHTGQMWTGLANAVLPVALGGKLFIAIYNDMGTQTQRWIWIKKTYNRLPRFLQAPYAALAVVPGEAKDFLRSIWNRKPGDYFSRWTRSQGRGMRRWRDIVDWVGGYPYEVATPEQIFDFYRERGFELMRMKCGGVGLGCNEFVLKRVS
jgi:2-polyprenyl-3-methyl-5-hydroxy-6-metoxy-1,4-benzoquinol methylase